MLAVTLVNGPFLQPDFTVMIIYFPTVLAGVVAFYVRVKARKP